jgi:crotonobetaine/carnitine-CoA ligase
MRTESVACQPLLPPQRTLPQLLRHAAERFGDRALLAMAGAAWTHRDAAGVAARRAAALRAAGVARGDRVAIMCSNRAEFLEAFIGCGWLGAVAVPINTAAMGPQIGYFLANSGARLLVIEAAFVERLAMAELSGTALQAIWVVGDAPDAASTIAGVQRMAWRCNPATRWRSSTPQAPPARPRA